MKKELYFLFISILFSVSVYAQDSIQAQQDAENRKPVRDPWASEMLIDNQTTLTTPKGAIEFNIQHRFTGFGNGIKDLYGFYGASNIRMALNYGLTKKIMVGFGTEKDRKYQEFYIKGRVLDQNRGGSIPVSVALFGNASINGREEAYWGNDYKFKDRLSYFAQVIVSRKFTDALSLEAAASYSHINKIEGNDAAVTKYNESLYQNNALGITAAGRYKFYNDYSFLAEYDQGFFTFETIGFQQLEPKPNIAFGFEKNTSTHTFQLFASTYRGLNPQQNFIENQTDFHYISQIGLGFNITVRF